MRMWPRKRPSSGFSGSWMVPSGYRKAGKSWAPILRVPFWTLLRNNLCYNQQKTMYAMGEQNLHWISIKLIEATQRGKGPSSSIVIPPTAVLLGPNNHVHHAYLKPSGHELSAYMQWKWLSSLTVMTKLSKASSSFLKAVTSSGNWVCKARSLSKLAWSSSVTLSFIGSLSAYNWQWYAKELTPHRQLAFQHKTRCEGREMAPCSEESNELSPWMAQGCLTVSGKE